MKFIKAFENYTNESILLIVDVQKSFRNFFTEMYLHDLMEYCNNFTSVYQIFDNHVDGKNVDKDYLYDEEPDLPVNGDLYIFPNQVKLVEKRYTYDVDVTFFRRLLDKDLYNQIKQKEDKGLLEMGNFFNTKYGTIIVYIGNNHNWIHVGKKLYNTLMSFKGKEITLVGGSDGECLLDVEVTAIALGVNVKRNFKFIYSANNCPIK